MRVIEEALKAYHDLAGSILSLGLIDVRKDEAAAHIQQLMQLLERSEKLLPSPAPGTEVSVAHCIICDELTTLYDALQSDAMTSYRGLLQQWSGSRTLGEDTRAYRAEHMQPIL